MIKVSDTAKKKVTELMVEDGFDITNDFIRVGVKSGGCSGLSYDLKFNNSQDDGDKVFEDNGVKIIVDKKSFLKMLYFTFSKMFETKLKKKLYMQSFKSNETTLKNVNAEGFEIVLVSKDNYLTIFKERNLLDYIDFYKENYTE